MHGVMRQRHSLLIFLLLALIQLSTPRDTITGGQMLKDGQLLVSANGTFALGFFSPGKSKNRYIGIWYNKVSEKTVVWVANRDNPINDTSGVLSFDSNSGNLVILNDRLKIQVWSTNFSSPARTRNHSAQLLDTGNLLVVVDMIVAWQSFDHPTDTALPTMKVGANRKTGMNWSLTAWKSPDDPGTGESSYRVDLSEYSEFSLCKGSNRAWRAGPWNGVRFSGIPEMSSEFIFNATYVDNQDEAYAISGMGVPSVYSKGMVNQSGVVEKMTWHEDSRRWVVFWSAPKDPCDYYGPNGICDFPTTGGRFECLCLPGFEPKSSGDWYLRDGVGRVREEARPPRRLSEWGKIRQIVGYEDSRHDDDTCG